MRWWRSASTPRTATPSPPGAGAAAPAAAATPPADGVGPLAGAELGPYLETSRRALAVATGEVVAVVSLTSYRTEADARWVVGDVPVLWLPVALPGRPRAPRPMPAGGSTRERSNGPSATRSRC